MRRLAWGWLLVGVLGCSIPDTRFRPSPDGGGGDATNTGVLAIVPSVTGLTVDENGDQQFSVTLNQAPAVPLSVAVETTSTKLGLSVPQLDFRDTNFAQPQTVTVTGLADLDVADELAAITLAAAGVEPVTVSTTVHDVDTLGIVTDVAANNLVTLDEGQSVNVRIKLSHRPAGDVSVMAILGTGPVTVMPSALVFTPQNFDTEQTLRLTAAADPNVTTDDQPLTIRMNDVDRLYTVRSVDRDVLNIAATPGSLTITEQGAAGNLSVALTQQPPADVIVTVATMSGHITTNKSQLTFTPQNYATTQIVQVAAPDDVDVEDDTDKVTLSTATPGVMSRDVTVSIEDNDTQQILEDAPATLAVAENGNATFNVTLKFEPAGTVNVSVASVANGVATATPGVLAFDPSNYHVPKAVTVHGTDDNNLAANTTEIRLTEASIGTATVPVNVTDDDQQRIVVSASTITIPEGTSGGFDVSLMFDPGPTVTASIANTNATALPSSPGSLTFTSSNFSQPHHVTVSPPTDTNNVSEMGTITVSGAGAATPATVMATAQDATTIDLVGWPTPFTNTIPIPQGMVVAYKVHVGATSNVDSFHTYVPSASGDYRMALYRNSGGVPGALVAEMPARRALVNGVNNAPILADPSITVDDYWIVIRFSQSTAVGYAPAGQTGSQCIRNIDMPNLDDPWPPTFGAVSCTVDNLINIWIATYHQ